MKNKEPSSMNTELIIIGAGAAGLMAACQAAEAKIPTILIERKHLPGRKLLMCGNNRCNLTSDLSTEEMLGRFGEPCADFLTPALRNCNAEKLRQWFHKHNLPTKVHKDQRVFPKTEKAADVLHCFTDLLREKQLPIVYNAAVTKVTLDKNKEFNISIGDITLTSRFLLIATGGVSYPKTGSVGDGQIWSKSLGHTIQPYRAGLVGFELNETWLRPRRGDIAFTGTRTTVFCNDQKIGETQGEILCASQMATGPAFLNASRLLARLPKTKSVHFIVDLHPNLTTQALTQKLTQALQTSPTLATAIAGKWLPEPVTTDFLRHVANMNPQKKSTQPDKDAATLAAAFKQWKIIPGPMRPLKEAIVTIGGVTTTEINPETMQSKRCPQLYFAGEVMDIDGPSGGFNLQAAFSTAMLAIKHIASQVR